jgi:hypothetical protein
MAKDARVTLQRTASAVDDVKCSWSSGAFFSEDLNDLLGTQRRQDLRKWVSPPDPSTNHNIACGASHKQMAKWFFEGSKIKEWKSCGSLLWIHGKRTLFLSLISRRFLMVPSSGSGSWQEHTLVRFYASGFKSRSSFSPSSSIIQDAFSLREAGPAIVAYFYFDFRDKDKQNRHSLLLSLVNQLSTRSDPCCDKLSRLFVDHDNGADKPSDDVLMRCLKEMLTILVQNPTYVIIDALDECPNTFGIPSHRAQVLALVKELSGLHLPNLRICITSRPEIDIKTSLGPLTSHSVSLHDEIGQKNDIVDYIKSVVYSDADTMMKKWRADEKDLVIRTLTERVDGM